LWSGRGPDTLEEVARFRSRGLLAGLSSRFGMKGGLEISGFDGEVSDLQFVNRPSHYRSAHRQTSYGRYGPLICSQSQHCLATYELNDQEISFPTAMLGSRDGLTSSRWRSPRVLLHRNTVEHLGATWLPSGLKCRRTDRQQLIILGIRKEKVIAWRRE
jgi:hypothetical protein